MPGRLLESAVAPRRSFRSMIPSLIIHAVIITLAARATAHATEIVSKPERPLVFVQIPIGHHEKVTSSGGAPSASARINDRSEASIPVPKTIPVPTTVIDYIPPVIPD